MKQQIFTLSLNIEGVTIEDCNLQSLLSQFASKMFLIIKKYYFCQFKNGSVGLFTTAIYEPSKGGYQLPASAARWQHRFQICFATFI
jgi:hypothetical protein